MKKKLINMNNNPQNLWINCGKVVDYSVNNLQNSANTNL